MQTVPVIIQFVVSSIFIIFLAFLCGRLFFKMAIQNYATKTDRSKQRETVKKIVQSKTNVSQPLKTPRSFSKNPGGLDA